MLKGHLPRVIYDKYYMRYNYYIGELLSRATRVSTLNRENRCGYRLGPALSRMKWKRSFRKSQPPHNPVNLFFILVIVKDKLTISWGS